jgi:hypothetical protein
LRNIDGTLKKPSLKVLEELPHGVTVSQLLSFREIKEASGYVDGNYKHFYYCPKCAGWIEGWPRRYGQHSLGPLSGRSGYVEDCARCGYELDFMGIVS